MVWHFDGGSIETKDYISVKVYNLIKDRRVVEALRFLIIAWSKCESINAMNVGRLRDTIGITIINGLFEKINWFMQLSNDKLQLIVKSMIKGFRLEGIGGRVAEEYGMWTMIAFDHKGNILHLPYSGGYLEQPIDIMRFLTVYRAMFLEELEAANKKR